MKYQIIRLNDNNTAHVELNYEGKLLNQDIDMGASADEFEANVSAAMLVLKNELKPKHPPVDYVVGQVKEINLDKE